jgi:hypothetical protein
MPPAEALQAEFGRRGIDARCGHEHLCSVTINNIDVEIWFGADISWQGNDGRTHCRNRDTAPTALADAIVDSLCNPA